MSQPLAERLRPNTLEEYLSQEHLIGEHGALQKQIKSGNIPSLILWGPPGVGKTTLANIIAKESDRPFYTLSAISSGVKDVREVIEKAKKSEGIEMAELYDMQQSGAISFADYKKPISNDAIACTSCD